MSRAHEAHVLSHLPERRDSPYVGCNKKKRETPWIVPRTEMAMAHYFPLLPARHAGAASEPVLPKRGFFRRLFAALIEARQHRAELEIARFIASAGGFTDSVEREIERRLFSKRSFPLS
jgi:hypothetical protein